MVNYKLSAFFFCHQLSTFFNPEKTLWFYGYRTRFGNHNLKL